MKSHTCYIIEIWFVQVIISEIVSGNQVGACVVNTDNQIVGVGYNGMPNRCSDSTMPWSKHLQDPTFNKYMYGEYVKFLVI